jgi:hypothetical protein
MLAHCKSLIVGRQGVGIQKKGGTIMVLKNQNIFLFQGDTAIATAFYCHSRCLMFFFINQ